MLQKVDAYLLVLGQFLRKAIQNHTAMVLLKILFLTETSVLRADSRRETCTFWARRPRLGICNSGFFLTVFEKGVKSAPESRCLSARFGPVWRKGDSKSH